jgi:hypothetical protein
MNGLIRAFCALATVVVVLALSSTVALADTPPEVPVTFSGTLAAGETQSFQFTVPDGDFYRATVRPASAPVTLTLTGGPYPSPPVPNWQTGPLWPVFTYTLDVHSAVATSYEVDVEEIPPKLTEVSGGTQYLGPNDVFTAKYTLDVPAYVEPVITSWNYGPTVVPVDFMMSPGPETFKWNLRDADGQRLPDGDYRVALQASNSTATSLPVPAGEAIIDTTPPDIHLRVDSPTSDHARVRVDVLDPGGHATSTMFSKVTASADGGPPRDLGLNGQPFWTWYTIPGGVWSPGKHTVTVQATDLLGNSASSSISFTVPAPRPRPDCDTLAIKNAVRTAQPVNAALRRIGHIRRGDVFRHFVIAKRSCPTELTHDTSAEMVTLLREQHGPKTVVAIFSWNGKGWSSAYVDAAHRVDSLDQMLWDPVENLHPKKPHAKLRRIRLHWDGSKFQQIPL